MSAASPVAGRDVKPEQFQILRRVFSFPVMLACLLMVLTVLTVRGRFDDPDMWWHLKDGQVIWNTHAIPTSDRFSYTTHHQASVPQEWFSETLIYGAYRMGGYSGLMLWLCFFGFLLLIAGYAFCSLYSRNAKIGFLGAMIVWFFATSGLAVRGQVVGYLLLLAELLLLHLGQTRNSRWFFALPVLFLVWVNCHGSFFFGLIVLGVFLFCSFCNFQAGSLVCLSWSSERRMKLMQSAVLSGAAVFLNPTGWRQVLYPVNTLLHQHIVVNQIDEWKPLVLSDARGAGLLGLLAFLSIFLIMRRSESLFLHEVLLLGMGAWLALSHRRMAFVFGILAAPIVSRILSKSWDSYDAATDRIAPNAICISIALVAAFAAFPSRQNLVKQVDNGSPVKAADFIEAHHLSGNMLNTFGDGGYLIWALPDHPVFVDGRADVFEWTGVLREFGEWATLQSDPNALLDKYHISFCLLERGAPMTHVLPLMHNWKEVYSDQSSVIFERADATVAVP